MSSSGKMIREARIRARLTQAELARLASTSQPTIAAYEAGVKIPSAETLERLLEVTGLRLTTVAVQKNEGSTHLRHLLKRHRTEILELALRHGAKNVRVFGSVARGEEKRNSDIDLLVDMERGRSLLDQVRLRRALGELLGVEVDVISTGGLRDSDAAISAESVPL